VIFYPFWAVFSLQNTPGVVVESRTVYDDEQINIGNCRLIYRNHAVNEESVSFEELSDV
jgi:hypothetical protein